MSILSERQVIQRDHSKVDADMEMINNLKLYKLQKLQREFRLVKNSSYFESLQIINHMKQMQERFE